MKDCDQFKCGHHPDNDEIPRGREKDLMIAMCPICAECSAQPHQINEGCKNCLLCECKEGFIRAGSPKPFLEIMVKEKADFQIIKEMIVKDMTRKDITRSDYNGKDQR